MDFLVDFLLNFHGPTPYLIVLGILLACGLGVPIPEDITLIAAGLMSYYGVSDLSAMIVLSMFGVIAGDSIVFFLGLKYGRALTKRGIFSKLLPENRLTAVREKFNQRGVKLLFFARFMPGLRAPIFFSAGTLHVPYSKFILYDGTAALLSVPAIVGGVYYFGDDIDHVVRVIKEVQHGILFVIFAVIAFAWIKWIIKQKKLKKTSLTI